MKKLLLLTLALLTMGSQLEASAAKKDKKGIKWEWDGTKSGNKIIDDYLQQIDTLYRNVQNYQHSIDSYVMKDTTLQLNGKWYQIAWMEDSQGHILTRATVNWQCVQAYELGANIILDMTNAGLGSASASLELPKLGLNAFKFGKYVKGGPTVITEGTKAIKTVRGKWIANSRKWKSMKDGAIENPKAIGYDGFSADFIQKLNKCFYIKEVKEDDPFYQEVIKTSEGKSAEEIAKDAKGWTHQMEQATILPEDKSKALDELPNVDDELES